MMLQEMTGREVLCQALADTGKCFYTRGWVMGTGGNFSAVLERNPLQLVNTPSAVHKGDLEATDLLVIGESGNVICGNGKPSAEATVHLAVVKLTGAGAVLHTHSVWGTVLSELNGDCGGFDLTGFEMLKGLSGVTTHEHHEWVPILPNTQDYSSFRDVLEEQIASAPRLHGFLLKGHGLYTWGKDVSEARRHVEIFEFLFEVYGRLHAAREK